MKLSVSNIAWAPDDTAPAYSLLESAGVHGLEFAPGILFAGLDDPLLADQAACEQALKYARDHGLELSSMQSLLFGCQNAALFEPDPALATLVKTMGDVIALAGRLGVKNLVFGSPKNRIIPDYMDAQTARDIWHHEFRLLGDLAATAGTRIAMEPNPTDYGTNFMVTLAETIAVVRDIDHPAIRVNLDLGALIMTGEIDEISDILARDLDLISHVHISMPFLASVTSDGPEIPILLAALRQHGYDDWVSIEMRQNFKALPEAIQACREFGLDQ